MPDQDIEQEKDDSVTAQAGGLIVSPQSEDDEPVIIEVEEKE